MSFPERRRKGREWIFQNKAHGTFDPRNTFSPVLSCDLLGASNKNLFPKFSYYKLYNGLSVWSPNIRKPAIDLRSFVASKSKIFLALLGVTFLIGRVGSRDAYRTVALLSFSCYTFVLLLLSVTPFNSWRVTRSDRQTRLS